MKAIQESIRLKGEKVRSLRWVFLLVATTLLAVRSAEAQLSGSGIPGFFGIKSGSQAPPGAYLSYIFLDYDTTKIIGQEGREILFQQGQIGLDGHLPGLMAVTHSRKSLGRTTA